MPSGSQSLPLGVPPNDSNGGGGGVGGSGGGGGGGGKGPDYVYFERRPKDLGEQTMQKSTAAKMRLELYYKEAVEGVVGRKERCVKRSESLVRVEDKVHLCIPASSSSR